MEKSKKGMNPQGMKKPPVNLFASLGKVFAYMKGVVPVVVICLIMAAASAILNMIGPNFIGQITTLMQQGLGSEINLGAIGKIGVFLLIIYGTSAILNFVYHFVMATVTLRTSKNLRGSLSEKISPEYDFLSCDVFCYLCAGAVAVHGVLSAFECVVV